MIKKVVKKVSLNDDSIKADLAYWLSKTSAERIEAVQIMRKRIYGDRGLIEVAVRRPRLPAEGWRIATYAKHEMLQNPQHAVGHSA